MPTHWIIIADAGGARVFEPLETGGHLKLVRELENPGGRSRDQDLVSDEPGRIDKGGRGILSAMDPPTSPHEQQAKRFALTLAKVLDAAAQAGDYDRVSLVAPPHFLGLLRKALSPAVERRIHKELARDLAHEDTPSVERFVAEFLDPRAFR